MCCLASECAAWQVDVLLGKWACFTTAEHEQMSRSLALHGPQRQRHQQGSEIVDHVTPPRCHEESDSTACEPLKWLRLQLVPDIVEHNQGARAPQVSDQRLGHLSRADPPRLRFLHATDKAVKLVGGGQRRRDHRPQFGKHLERPSMLAKLKPKGAVPEATSYKHVACQPRRDRRLPKACRKGGECRPLFQPA